MGISFKQYILAQNNVDVNCLPTLANPNRLTSTQQLIGRSWSETFSRPPFWQSADQICSEPKTHKNKVHRFLNNLLTSAFSDYTVSRAPTCKVLDVLDKLWLYFQDFIAIFSSLYLKCRLFFCCFLDILSQFFLLCLE